MEPLHLPHRPQFDAGRDLERAGRSASPASSIATLAQDYAFGRDGVAAFREALKPTGAKLVAEEYAPPATTDFTAPAQRLFDALAKEPGRKMIWVIWAGGDPMPKLKALNPERSASSCRPAATFCPC